MSARPGMLHVVEIAARAAEPKPPASPETSMRRLFKREAVLERELLELRQAVGLERARYAAKHRLGCYPPIDTLRRLFS
jgi:DNA-binding FadR family transcriptional regulator